MRCINHPDKEAVAVCRACLKGLCAECGEPVVRGLACHGECAAWLRDYDGLMNEALENYRKRVQHQTEFEEKRKQAAESSTALSSQVTTRHPGPTMRERAAAYHATTLKPSPPVAWRPRWNLAFFLLVVGIVFIIWGVIEVDDYLFILVLGLVLTGFALYRIGLTRGRQQDLTSTANTKQSQHGLA